MTSRSIQNELSTGERIQNAKTAYDLEIDDHAESECDLCASTVVRCLVLVPVPEVGQGGRFR